MEKQLILKLKSEGFDKVYVWDGEPNEEDTNHSHLFDTKIVILKGDIEIETNGKKSVLKSGDEMEIPRNKIHAAIVGLSGCRYIVAERR